MLTLSPQAICCHVKNLTPRQREIIMHLASGRTDKETATLLSINVGTVRQHIYTARNRIGVENRIQLVSIFAVWKYVIDNPFAHDGICRVVNHVFIDGICAECGSTDPSATVVPLKLIDKEVYCRLPLNVAVKPRRRKRNPLC